MNYKASNNSEAPIFELFAAMKWIGYHGDETGINGKKTAIVGSQLGANIVAILSLMALHDDCTQINLQILIDLFFSFLGNFRSKGKCIIILKPTEWNKTGLT